MRRAWRSRRPGVKTQSATIAPRIRRVGDSRCLTSDGAKRYLSAAPRLSPIARRRDCDGAPQNGTKRAHGRRRCEESDMRRLGQQVVAVVTMFSFLFLMVHTTRAADPEIDRMIRGPVGKDWVTNGGNLTNQRYSTLKQIDTANVGQLKGAWMTRLKGSGAAGKYSFEASPLVKDGIMYVVTGNDDVFALNAKTGAIIWEYWSGIDQKISTVCCGWVNRGRDDLEHAGPRSRPRARLLRHRQLRTGLRRLDARGRQPLLRLDDGPEGQDRRVRLAFPASAPRH